MKYFNITIIGFTFITAIILIKYKPTYIVKISGEELGYIQNKEAFVESIKNEIIEKENKNIDSVDIKENPEYELKFVDRTIKTNEEQIVNNIQEDILITYKYYDIALNNKTIESVNTLEEAEDLVSKVKEENKDENIDLSIIEKYTQNADEIKTTDIEIAKNDINTKIEENKAKKEEEERINSLPDVNGIKLATKPVSGTITSRYGVNSRIRRSSHTGLDIATTKGTPIKVVADGTVICASYSGSYGNLVKIDHGNGVETWYAHTCKMYVSVGEKVTTGQTIAAVGSTGNSTGAHLHFEIRVNGTHVNPQNYLYN